MKNKWKINNEFAADKLFELLEKLKIAKRQLNVEVSDNGFELDFEVEKNISEKQLIIFEGKINKQLTNLKLDDETIKFIKLRGISGIVHEGTPANRIFGFAADSRDQLDKKLKEIDDRESRDHRKIAKELEIFIIDETVGKGLPIWLPNGVAIKREIQKFIYEQEDKYGYQQVETPVLGSIELYKISGHYSHYSESMFPEMKIEENETFMLRPMACPHHVIIYKHKPRSYRDLPIRYAEQVKQYRYESSGSLLGLERVRAMELTDSHIFLREDQLGEEIAKVYELIKDTLDGFEIKIHSIELALHDKNDLKKYHGEIDLWKKSEKMLKSFLDSSKIQYDEKVGEAAFYGPKIDIQIETALGHILTISTIQLDFLLPERFDIHYIDKDKNKLRPIMIHRGLIGTYERFISVLLEQTKGDLPFWLAPRQAVILPIKNSEHLEYATKIFNVLKANKIRVVLDDSDERLANKIRHYQTSKTKFQIVIGDEEVKNKSISFRKYGEEKIKTLSLKEIDLMFN